MNMSNQNCDGGKVSDPKVMHSAAGYYIGTTYDEDGFSEPNSRLSQYFTTATQAESQLAKLQAERCHEH